MEIVLKDLFNCKQGILENKEHVREGANWLVRAHERSPDKGLSRGYYFSLGWEYSHVGCAGDAAETMFNASIYLNDVSYRSVAETICDWLVQIQLPCGGFHRSYVFEKEPRVLNTALAIFGLIRAFEVTNESIYLDTAVRAGDWVRSVQEDDGTWRKHNFIDKTNIFTYHTKTAYALCRLYSVTGNSTYLESCTRNLDWALTQQLPNGYFRYASMNGDRDPQTHLIAYVLRGLVETGIFINESRYISAVERSMQGIMESHRRYNFIPATYNSNWENYNAFYNEKVTTSCLCGNAEISIVSQRLFEYSGGEEYLNFSTILNNELKTMQDTRCHAENVRGGLKGSSKIYGIYYERFAFPNWSVKFFIDAILLEEKNKVHLKGESS